MRPSSGWRAFGPTVRLVPARDRLGEIRVPTTVVHGTADPVFTIWTGEALARDIPGARFVALPGGGHELPPAAWGAVVEAVAATRSSG